MKRLGLIVKYKSLIWIIVFVLSFNIISASCEVVHINFDYNTSNTGNNSIQSVNYNSISNSTTKKLGYASGYANAGGYLDLNYTPTFLGSDKRSYSFWFKGKAINKYFFGSYITSHAIFFIRTYTVQDGIYIYYDDDYTGWELGFYSNMADGNWHHIVYVDDGTNLTLYIDNSVEHSHVSDKAQDFSNKPFYLFAYNNNGVADQKGEAECYIDDFRIYEFALTSNNVSTLYNNSYGTPDGLCAVSDSNTAPTIQEVDIDPSMPYNFQDLEGYCNATDLDGDDINYFWKLYKNNELKYSFLEDGLCYQENANLISPCGGLNTGAYTYTGDWFYSANTFYDGNWESFAYATMSIPYPGYSHIFVNYSIPSIAEYGSILQVKNVEFTENFTISKNCWDYGESIGILEFWYNISMTGVNINQQTLFCKNSSSEYEMIYYNFSNAGNNPRGLYEEAMFFNFSISNHTEGNTINIVNLSNTLTSVGENWVLSCKAYDGVDYSNWVNSSSITILPTIPDFTYSDIDTGLTNLTLSIDTLDNVNISISGDITYENSTFNQNKSFIFTGLNPHTFYTLNLTICNEINNCSDLGTVGLTKTRLNFTAKEIISSLNINSYLTNITYLNINDTDFTTTSLISFIVGNDTHTDYIISGNSTSTATNYININYTNYNFSATGELLINTVFYSTVLNVTAFDLAGGGISDFNITLTSLNYSYSTSLSSSDNWTSFNLVNGSYNVSIESNGYADNWKSYIVQGLDYETLNFTLLESEWINFFFYDEETDSLLTTRNITLEVISTNHAENFSTENGTLGTNLTVGSYTFRYSAYDYPERFYYMDILESKNYTANLYLLKNSTGTEITVTLYDQNNQKVEGYNIKVLKYDLATNSYILRDMEKTDISGKSYLNVVLFSEFYKFIVENPAGDIKLTTETAYIYDDTLNLQIIIGEETGEDYFKTENINWVIDFLPSTNKFRLTYSDPSNTLNSMTLKVYRLSALNGSTLYNETSIASPSGSMTIWIENITGTTYEAKAYASFPDEYFLGSKMYHFFESLPFGVFGVFLTFILVLTAALIGYWSLMVAVILVPVIVTGAAAIGLIQINIGLAFSLIILGIIIATLINGLKNG